MSGSNGGRSTYIQIRSSRAIERRKAAAVNHYEYVAVAIRQGIYDETIFKNASYTTLIKLYDRTKPFIDEMRRIKAPTVWQEFEWLMLRWKACPLPVKKFKSIEDRNFWQKWFGD